MFLNKFPIAFSKSAVSNSVMFIRILFAQLIFYFRVGVLHFSIFVKPLINQVYFFFAL